LTARGSAHFVRVHDAVDDARVHSIERGALARGSLIDRVMVELVQEIWRLRAPLAEQGL
jgi:hypothetical protein